MILSSSSSLSAVINEIFPSDLTSHTTPNSLAYLGTELLTPSTQCPPSPLIKIVYLMMPLIRRNKQDLWNWNDEISFIFNLYLSAFG